MKIKQLTPILTIAGLCLLSFISKTEDPIDKLGVKAPLTFNNSSFKLAWAAKPNENYYVQEYLPETETTETFKQMLTINLFITETDPKNAVQQKTKELDARKKTDPVCSYEVNESPDGKEFLVDFLVGKSEGDKMTVAEFNIYRYKQIELADHKKAILVFVYSKRSYKDEITPFLTSLGKERTKYLNEMISTALPAVKIVKE